MNTPVLCISTRPLGSRLPPSRRGFVARCRRCAALPTADAHRIQRHLRHARPQVREDEVVRHLRVCSITSNDPRGTWQGGMILPAHPLLMKGCNRLGQAASSVSAHRWVAKRFGFQDQLPCSTQPVRLALAGRARAVADAAAAGAAPPGVCQRISNVLAHASRKAWATPVLETTAS